MSWPDGLLINGPSSAKAFMVIHLGWDSYAKETEEGAVINNGAVTRFTVEKIERNKQIEKKPEVEEIVELPKGRILDL